MPIKNVIFDLGGVLFDIDYALPPKAFKDLGVINFDVTNQQGKQTGLFDQFETGKISTEQFCQTLREQLKFEDTNRKITDAEVFSCMNAILITFPQDKLDYITTIKNKGFNVYLYSNIDPIRYAGFEEICKKLGIENFNGRFVKPYYSHFFGFRKPHTESFEAVIKDAGIDPKDSIFLDDREDNLKGASEAGLHCYLVDPKNARSIFGVETVIDNLNFSERVASVSDQRINPKPLLT